MKYLAVSRALPSCQAQSRHLTVAGATSSGKTTLTGWMLSTIPDDKRIYTIESGSRELDLVKRDEKGKVINKVIHTMRCNGLRDSGAVQH